MRCHYEALALERFPPPSNAEIKKAYRSQALEWHPDKNGHRLEEAHIRMQEITQAYTVLSDKQEREWYDNHREDILQGGDGTKHKHNGDETSMKDAYVYNVWACFSVSMFNGKYDDSEDGFYSVYSRVFADITTKEVSFLHTQQNVTTSAGTSQSSTSSSSSSSNSNILNAPTFGTSISDRKSVMFFYSFWSTFTSIVSFSWEDEYNLTEAPNRQYKRAMEKENKKERDIAKKKYQEGVRGLVEYIRKRDKRLVNFEMEQLKKEKAKKALKEEEAKIKTAIYNQKREEYLTAQRQKWEEEEKLRAQTLESGDGNGGDDGSSSTNHSNKLPFRLADEESSEEDDDDESKQKGGRKKKKKRNKSRRERAREEAHEDYLSKLEANTCEICNKSFKSEKQYQNHTKSKAHRQMMKLFEEEYGDDAIMMDLLAEKEFREDMIMNDILEGRNMENLVVAKEIEKQEKVEQEEEQEQEEEDQQQLLQGKAGGEEKESGKIENEYENENENENENGNEQEQEQEPDKEQEVRQEEEQEEEEEESESESDDDLINYLHKKATLEKKLLFESSDEDSM